MREYTVKSIDDFEAIHHGVVKLAGAGLGIRSFGLQVLDLPAGFDHPEHDHSADGQEEVYVLLEGAAELHVDGDRTTVSAGELVRIGPPARRKLVPGPAGARVLAIGCSGDRAYERPHAFQLQARA